MSTDREGLREAIAVIFCEEAAVSWALLPETATYLQRKSTSGMAVHDREEARFVADRILDLPALANAEEKARVAEANAAHWKANYDVLLAISKSREEDLTRRVSELEGEGTFLLDRLRDFEAEVNTKEAIREWFGHVQPSISRLAALLDHRTDATEEAPRG